MTTYYAFEPRTDGEIYRFRKLSALVRRLGGDAWHTVHGETDGMRCTVEITKWRAKVNGHEIIIRLRVPNEAVKEAYLDEDGYQCAR